MEEYESNQNEKAEKIKILEIIFNHCSKEELNKITDIKIINTIKLLTKLNENIVEIDSNNKKLKL